MAQHNDTGKKGEELAVNYLKNKGYIILATNYRYKQWEVDIIAKQGKDLVVAVEVKTRQSRFMAGPEETVSKAKQKSIITVMDTYLKKQPEEYDVRFDIISVIMNSNTFSVEHLEDAFYPII